PGVPKAMSSDGYGAGDPQRPQGKPPPRQARLTPEISESILKSLTDRTGPGRSTDEWVTGLGQADEGADSAARTAYETQPVVDMVQAVEKLFDLFTKYAFEFNKAMNFTGPTLDVERPVHVKAGDPRYGSHGQAAFSGRLTIQQWSMVIRGQDKVIEGF